MLKLSVRRNISLVMFIALMGLSALFWAMDSTSAEGLADGVYTGAAQSFNGELKLEVTVSGGRVVGINVVSHNDTPGVSDGAFEQVIPAIIEAQSADVDAASGATVTSKAIMKAFEAALPAQLEDGVHQGVGQGFSSEIEAKVTVANGRIASIEVSHDDTPSIADKAVEEITAAMIEAQSADVDTISGATRTSRGVIQAVNDALGR